MRQSMPETTDIAVRLTAATRALTEGFRLLAPKLAEAARAWRAFIWRYQLAEYLAIGMTRPDGRPRRSGHRHRGMRDWHRRYRTRQTWQT